MILSFSELGVGELASHQQLLGSTSKSQTGLGSGQELDSGMHGSESGSGTQVEQQAGSSSEASHGQREEDPRDPPALSLYGRHGMEYLVGQYRVTCPVRPSL